MSTLVTQPENIIKPETPMPSPTTELSAQTEGSRMTDKGLGFASPPLSSNSGGTPPKSPTHSKLVWSNPGSNWNANSSSGPARYQAAQNYGHVAHSQNGQYALDRGDGTVSRLIPADELPFDIVGVPRREAPGSFSVLSGQFPQGPPCQVVRMDHGQVTASPTGLGLSRMDYQIPHSLRAGLPYDGSNMSYGLAVAAPAHPEVSQREIDEIVNRPRVHQSQMVRGRQKIYCDKWLQTGNCGFQQVGCKYKHVMPMDRATQESVGLNGLPDWYVKSNGISLRPQLQGARPAVTGRPGDKSWRSREAEIGGLRAGLSSREFGIRPAVAPNRKPVPLTRQLTGSPLESLNAQLDARIGNLSIEGSAADRRIMNPNFSDLGTPLGAEVRRDFGAIGDRLSLSTSFPSPTRKVGSNSGVGSYTLSRDMADQNDKKFDAAVNLDEDSHSDYSGGITPF